MGRGSGKGFGRGGMDGESQAKGCCCCTVLVVIIILIATSIKSIDPNEIGLEYNPNTQTLDTTKIHGPGRPFLGPGHYFIKFPTQNENIKRDLHARTKDGLKIVLTVSFNFRLRSCIRMMSCPGVLSDLYLKLGAYQDIKSTYERISRNSLRSVAAKYNAFDYFARDSSEKLKSDMQLALNRDLGAWEAEVDSFQLTKINLGKGFESARAEQEQALQEQLVVDQELTNNATVWDGIIDQQRTQALQIMQQAEAQANLLLRNANATARSLQAKLLVESAAFKRTMASLALTEEELLAYIWIDAVQGKDAKALVDVDIPTLLQTPPY